jgi:hypothetical protein
VNTQYTCVYADPVLLHGMSHMCMETQISVVGSSRCLQQQPANNSRIVVWRLLRISHKRQQGAARVVAVFSAEAHTSK